MDDSKRTNQILSGVEEVVIAAPKKAVKASIFEIRWLCRVLISSADRFYWDNGFSKAASLAYTTLFSLVPITALLFGILGSFGVLKAYAPQVREFLFHQFVPTSRTSETVLEYLNQFSETLSNRNILVVAVLVFTAILLINSVEYALNEIWQVFEPRSYAERIAIFCAIILIAPVLAISAYYFTSLNLRPFLSTIMNEGVSIALFTYLVPYSIDFLAFLSLYYLVPKAPVKLTSAIFGALVAALLFDLAKDLFVIYIEQFSSYSAVYGTIAAVPIFLFWLYLAWTIVLIGAECSYQFQYLPKTGALWKHNILSVGDGGMLLAVQALVMVARAFSEGRELPNDLDIAEKLGCSSTVLKPALNKLENAGIISRGGSRNMPITLLKSPDKVGLEEIREALFKTKEAVFYPKEISRLFGRFVDGQDAKSATLADIL